MAPPVVYAATEFGRSSVGGAGVQKYQVGDNIKFGSRVERIKSGGMGVVYITVADARSMGVDPSLLKLKARDGPLPQFRQAIKSTTSNLNLSKNSFETANREALLWISLPPHPNVVQAKSFEVEAGYPFLTLEYMPGGNLRENFEKYMQEDASLVRLCLDVCSGLAFLYRHFGIVHWDLKPENILFDEESKAKITDFGLSITAAALFVTAEGDVRQRPVGDAERALEISGGGLGGTLPYMSPEHFLPNAMPDTRSDIYSFGCMLYELLSGKPPFLAATPLGFMQAHSGQPHLPLDFSATSLKAELARIVDKCLQKQPRDRYDSFEVLFAEIDAVAVRFDLPISSRPRLLGLEEVESELTSSDWNNRGYALRSLGRLEEAVSCYDRGILVASGEEKREGTFFVVPGEKKPVQRESADVTVLMDNKAAALLRLQRVPEAILVLKESLRIDPEGSMATLRLGQIEIAQGRCESGLELVERAVVLAPGNLDFLGKLLNAAVECGSEKRLKSAVKRIVRLGREHKNPMLLAHFAGNVLRLSLRHGRGARIQKFAGLLVRAAEGLDKRSAEALKAKGVVEALAGRWGSASKAYTRLIEAGRADPEAYLLRALARLRSGGVRPESILTDIEMFIRLAPPESPVSQLIAPVAMMGALGLGLLREVPVEDLFVMGLP